MSELRSVQSRKRKSFAEGAKEETSREPKRPRICMRAVVEKLSEWRMDATLLVFSTIVPPKSGGSADIAKANILNSTPPSPEGQYQRAVVSIAVKKFRFDDDPANKKVQAATFANELTLLSELCHENVIRWLGFIESPEERIAWIVLPWEANGNLREFVQLQDWAIPERLSLMGHQIHDVACGIEYLHSRNPPICHADLKSLNILVNSDNHAVITDFGSARKIQPSPTNEPRTQDLSFKPPLSVERHSNPKRAQSLFQLKECGTFITLTGPVYTLRWAAPEVLLDEKFGLASDIWAFGWICWEIMTGNIPFDDLRADAAVILRVTQGALPIVASNEHISQVRALCRVMTRCWAMDPAQRPEASECRRSMGWMVRSSENYDLLANFIDPHMQSKIAPVKRDASSPDDGRLARLYCALGYTKHANREAKEAADYFIKAFNVASLTGNQLLTAVAALGLGSVSTSQGEYVEADTRSRQARDIFDEVGYQVGVANAEWGLGEIFRLRNKYSEAENSYMRAMAIYSQAGDQPGVANAYLGLGDTYRLRDQHSTAEGSYLAAKQIYAEFEDHPGVAHAAWALGEVYRCQADLVKAEESYVEARRIYIQIDDRSGVANTTWGLGELYRLRDEFDEAEVSYVKAREIYAKLDDWKGVADAEWGLGEVYRRQGEYAKAKASYAEAREISTRIGYEWGVTSALSSQTKLEE
ncbi:hypothetical protein FRC01_004844 [Tulasnella sp. 417]|nr:hypothetical protein FRC01_004844 [Tulasnella sp. 417]